MKKIDLHVHSTASDGTLLPKEIVKLAYETGLSAFALTDHDTIDGIEEAMEESKNYDLEVIPGIEFAADYHGKEIHILGLNINYKQEYFKNSITQIKLDRENRNLKMINKLNELGFEVTIDELYTLAEGHGTITRAHFAKLLLLKGYVKTRKEAFDKYIGDGCPAYIKREILNSQKCIELILKANGIPILAHPTLYNMNNKEIEIMVKELITYGLEGIEAIYPLYTSQQSGDIKALAKKYNLKISGGSDFHGANKPNIALGTGISQNISISYEVLENLLS